MLYYKVDGKITQKRNISITESITSSDICLCKVIFGQTSEKVSDA